MRLLVILCLIVLTGCATTTEPPVARVQDLSVPPEGTTQTMELGDPLVAKVRRTTIPSYELLTDFSTPKSMGIGNFIKSGVLTPLGTRSGTEVFRPEEVYTVGGPRDGMLLPDPMRDIMVFSKVNGGLCFVGSQDLCLSTGQYQPADYIDYSAPYFEQELIYNGRVGDSVRFIYREYGAKMARDAFTQEIQYDLGESMLIGFKGARLEVKEATNREITYTLIENFPPR